MHDLWLQHLQQQGATFADGRVKQFAADPDSSMPPAALCDLSHYGAIRVTGPDAAAFLHAQLTNDVLALPIGGAQWNAWCTPKGRMLVSMQLWRDAEGFLLWMPRALQAAVQKRLGLFVLRAKVSLSDVSDAQVFIGVTGEKTSAAVAAALGAAPAPGRLVIDGDAVAIGLSTTRVVLTAPPARAIALWERLSPLATPAGDNVWTLAAIREGAVEIRPETVEAYVPQMANFDLIGGLSFQKGCYPGQEIVARTQYRGTLKRRTAHVSGACHALPPPGTEVFSHTFGDQAVGSVAIAAWAEPGRMEALVVAQRDSIAAHTLHLGAPDGIPLTIESLPYAIPD